MRPTHCISALLLWACSAAAFFQITNPTTGTEWVDGQTNVVTWEKGLLDNIPGYDVELTRMSQDQILYVAKNVPGKPAGLNIVLDNVPPATDYVLIFINSTHGQLHGTSKPFSILKSGSTPSASSPTVAAVDKAQTATVSGGPNPTTHFQTVFPELDWRSGAASLAVPRGVLGAVMAVALGGAWVVL
ncbi:hypothetical protein DFP72DRAFT_920418 [Ephemerocybe angulata]|uniref:Ser-Thr-rich glycosyl-phosphatidyl-inositol-anchored membrane family-domain-containing protein n=1 Tax=Ephemerocybe angulata TaxID=980116 RepID=A0A8H6HKB3_9AGAR|nr:hypothetical protein DFP72DRAFT_920418 [Tulosesus angulatus]